MNRNTFKKYIWLIDTIYQSGNKGINYETLCQKWQESGIANGKSYPLRTFHNHRKEIGDVFNISILCRKSTNCYYIDENREANPILKKLLELISVNQIVGEDSLNRGKLEMEGRPGGENFLSRVMKAIIHRNYIQIHYKPYWSDNEVVYPKLAPFALKEFKGCWYLLGERASNNLEFINLKEVTRVLLLQETFMTPEDAVISAALSENFGTKVEAVETQEITIKVDASLAMRLRNNPIHSSQRELEVKRSFSIFYFFLKPTAEFCREVLSFGSSAEVLMPLSLKSLILQEAKKIVRLNS